MWIVLRFLVAFIALFARRETNAATGKPRPVRGYLADGTPWFEDHVMVKGHPQEFLIGVPLRLAANVRCRRKPRFVRVLEKIGIVPLLRSGDAALDADVLVAAYDPRVIAHLRASEPARIALRRIFATQARGLYIEAGIAWIRYADSRGANSYPKRLLLELREAWRPLEGLPRKNDRLRARIAGVEALTWSLGGYAIVAWFDLQTHSLPMLVDRYALLPIGLALGGIGFVVTVACLALFLRGSAHAVLVMTEVLLVLGLAMPIVGVQTACDINRLLDVSDPVMVRRTITGKFVIRIKRNHAYAIHLDAPFIDGDSGRRVLVDEATFSRARVNATLVILLGEGALGARWYRGFDVADGESH